MLKSMTGFGRSEAVIDGRHIIVEVKSVNHKFFEYSLKITRGFNFLEDKLKSYVQSRVSRGKVDMYVHIENLEDSEVEIMVNHNFAKGYIKAYEEIKEKYNLKSEISLELLTKNNEIFSVHKKQEDEEAVLKSVMKVLEPAVDLFIEMRETEGQRLYDDILSRADNIISLVEKVEKRSPDTVSEYRQKLEAKMREIVEDKNIDEQRILLEAAIFADKVAVAEETVRLRSHIEQLKSFAKSNASIGRKMDFLVQEINREANTIGSKAMDPQIAYVVVDLKSEVEKIREQIQNIE
ncbi:MAG: YicC/YloC family endoribonuclease [Clostridia bacterium]